MKRQQPVGKWARRFVLMACVVMFLPNIGRVLDGNTIERVLSTLMMAGAVILFITWWRMPTTDSSHTKDQS